MSNIRDRWLSIIRRFMRDPERPASDAYWSPSLDCASRDELRFIQDQKLRVAVQYVYECIPFYRRKFDALGLHPADIRGVDDLHLIPVTTKIEMADDLAANPPWGTYTALDEADWLRSGWQIFTTSGTTGKPRPFRYTHFDRELWAWNDARALWAIGVRPSRDSAMLAFGYGPHVFLWGVHYSLNLIGIPIVSGGGLDSRMRARFIDEFRPSILCCTPTYALYLATVMREMGADPATSSIRFLLCGGEPGYSVPATRERLERTWGAELHEFYGCTEASPAAGGYTCSAAAADKHEASVHLMEDAQVWETVDPATLAPVSNGTRGLSVVTNLSSEASPQIRFLAGDFTALTDERCRCGRTHIRALGGFVGRSDDMLNVRGVTIFPGSIEDAVRNVSMADGEFEVVITSERDLDVMTVRIEPAAGLGDHLHGELARQVESGIISRCELRPVVEVVARGSIPRSESKSRRVRDLRK